MIKISDLLRIEGVPKKMWKNETDPETDVRRLVGKYLKWEHGELTLVGYSEMVKRLRELFKEKKWKRFKVVYL